MRIIKVFLVTIATLITAVIGGALASEIYRRVRYPHVAAEETDVFFDIGLVFFLGFATVIVVSGVACLFQARKRRALAGTRANELPDNEA